jgi:two-component system chemotaxis response regulator CheB/two-component system chemotaxis response regulator CheY
LALKKKLACIGAIPTWSRATRAKIVILSSIAVEGSDKARQARALGADAVIQKPSGSVSFDLAEKSGHHILETLQRLVP